MAAHPLYSTWRHMIDRCENPKDDSYYWYGARGISICAEWRNSFAAFVQYLGPKPSSEHTIDRIDNDGNYEPGNVRWATREQQNRNKRNNHWIEIAGRNLLQADWAKIGGMLDGTLHTRVKVFGWDPEKAVTTPVKRRRKGLLFRGIFRSQAEWEQEFNLSRSTISARLSLGWTVEEAITTPQGCARGTTRLLPGRRQRAA